jgi:hypothetical protein
MSTSEKIEEAKLVRWLKKNKIKCKKKAIGELLDRWLLLPEAHLFILELKKKNALVNPKTGRRQLKEIKDLRELGYDVEVHDSASEAIKAIELRLEAARLSKTGHKVYAEELLRGSLLRSWTRDDKYYARCFKDPQKRKNV